MRVFFDDIGGGREWKREGLGSDASGAGVN